MTISWCLTHLSRQFAKRREAHPLFHSDRGLQYTSKVFQSSSQAGNGAIHVHVGHCIDNCPVEGSGELCERRSYSLNKFSNGDELRSAIGNRYVHLCTNVFQERFGVRTPMEVRAAALDAKLPEQFRLLRTNGFRNTKRNARHNRMPQIPMLILKYNMEFTAIVQSKCNAPRHPN